MLGNTTGNSQMPFRLPGTLDSILGVLLSSDASSISFVEPQLPHVKKERISLIPSSVVKSTYRKRIRFNI